MAESAHRLHMELHDLAACQAVQSSTPRRDWLPIIAAVMFSACISLFAYYVVYVLPPTDVPKFIGQSAVSSQKEIKLWLSFSWVCFFGLAFVGSWVVTKLMDRPWGVFNWGVVGMSFGALVCTLYWAMPG